MSGTARDVGLAAAALAAGMLVGVAIPARRQDRVAAGTRATEERREVGPTGAADSRVEMEALRARLDAALARGPWPEDRVPGDAELATRLAEYRRTWDAKGVFRVAAAFAARGPEGFPAAIEALFILYDDRAMQFPAEELGAEITGRFAAAADWAMAHPEKVRPALRAALAELLGESPSPPGVDRLLELLVAEKDGAVASRLASSLNGRLGVEHIATMVSVAPRWPDQFWPSHEIALAIGRIPDPAAAEALRRLARDCGGEMAKAARFKALEVDPPADGLVLTGVPDGAAVLRQHDLVVAVEDAAVADSRTWDSVLKANRRKPALKIRLYRDGALQEVFATIAEAEGCVTFSVKVREAGR